MAGGRAMIVTGASSGIGRALAERAARAAYGVLAVGRRADRLDELVRNAAAHGGVVVPLALDLREPGAPERIVAAAVERFGRIDVLVNNAGGASAGSLTLQSDGALREQFETHVFVPLALLREALDPLRASRGHVFFIGSGVARVPVSGLGAYPSAKAAVRSLSRTVRNELRSEGIAVTYVDPGAVDTEFMARAGMAPAPRSILVSAHEVARKIFNAIGTDRRVVNAVPWQTAFVALAEHFPQLTDSLLARAPQLVGGAALPARPPSLAPLPGIPLESAAPPIPAQSPQPPAPPESPASVPPEAAGTPEPPDEPPLPQAPGAPPEPAEPAEPPPPEGEAFARGRAALAPPRSALEVALALHAARMRKLNLTLDFVVSLLVPGAELELGEVAMRWAGMPNKNERAVTLDVLNALADARFLAREGTHRYRVLHPAEATP